MATRVEGPKRWSQATSRHVRPTLATGLRSLGDRRSRVRISAPRSERAPRRGPVPSFTAERPVKRGPEAKSTSSPQSPCAPPLTPSGTRRRHPSGARFGRSKHSLSHARRTHATRPEPQARLRGAARATSPPGLGLRRRRTGTWSFQQGGRPRAPARDSAAPTPPMAERSLRDVRRMSVGRRSPGRRIEAPAAAGRDAHGWCDGRRRRACPDLGSRARAPGQRGSPRACRGRSLGSPFVWPRQSRGRQAPAPRRR